MDVPYGSNTKGMQCNSLQASFILCPIQDIEDTEMSHSQPLYSISSKSSGKDSYIRGKF